MKFFKATYCQIIIISLTATKIIAVKKACPQLGIKEIIANITIGKIKWKKVLFFLKSSSFILTAILDQLMP